MIGSLLLKFSILSGFCSVVLRNRFFLYLQSLLCITSCLILLIAFINSDFSVQNVLFFSSKQSPLIYRIAALWGNGDSSLLFWTSTLSLVTLFATITEKDTKILKFISSIFSIGLILLCSYIYLFSNPFVLVPNPPLEGMGMNPVLQDMAISIHPPILYLGYVTYFVIFAYSAAILWIKDLKPLSRMLFFSRIGFGFLSAGISLGSWWAYRELGWGGYWYFDPVENIALLPWLIAIVLHHALVMSVKKGSMVRSSIFLGMLNFLLVIFGMILVRSGQLVSVHSFAANMEAGIYIIGIFMIILAGSLYWYFGNISSLLLDMKHQRNKLIEYGSIFLCLAALSILVGIIYPLIYKILYGIAISLDNRYFQIIFMPLGLIISLFTLASLLLDRQRVFVGFFSQPPSKILSHLGISIMVLGIILNNLLSQKIEFIGKEGQEIIYNDNLKVKLQNIRYSNGPNYYRQIAEFWIYHKDEIIVLKPENRLYRVENMLSAESDIYSFLDKDFYAVLGNVDKDKKLYANIYIKAWMSLIWLGMFLTSIGIGISFTKVSRA